MSQCLYEPLRKSLPHDSRSSRVGQGMTDSLPLWQRHSPRQATRRGGSSEGANDATRQSTSNDALVYAEEIGPVDDADDKRRVDVRWGPPAKGSPKHNFEQLPKLSQAGKEAMWIARNDRHGGA